MFYYFLKFFKDLTLRDIFFFFFLMIPFVFYALLMLFNPFVEKKALEINETVKKINIHRHIETLPYSIFQYDEALKCNPFINISILEKQSLTSTDGKNYKCYISFFIDEYNLSGYYELIESYTGKTLSVTLEIPFNKNKDSISFIFLHSFLEKLLDKTIDVDLLHLFLNNKEQSSIQYKEFTFNKKTSNNIITFIIN